MAILTRGLGMTAEEVEVFLVEIRQAINSKSCIVISQCKFPFHITACCANDIQLYCV